MASLRRFEKIARPFKQVLEEGIQGASGDGKAREKKVVQKCFTRLEQCGRSLSKAEGRSTGVSGDPRVL